MKNVLVLKYMQFFVTNNEVNKYLDTLATSETSLKLLIQQGIKTRVFHFVRR